jgi:very-short-patch-repair endonuclease
VTQQLRIGRYRVDFAWPDVHVVLEVHGWWHRSLDGAVRDAVPDSWLRSQGWPVLRVDDRSGMESMLDQVIRAIQVVHGLRGDRVGWR